MSDWRELYNRTDEELISSHIEIYENIDLIIRSEDLVDDVIRELDACIAYSKSPTSAAQLSAEMLKMHILTKRRESVIETFKYWATNE